AWIRFRRMVLYRIADPGPGFRFEDLTHAAVSYAPEDRLQYVDKRLEKGLRPGGFGILMAQAMVDELIYNEVHNEVVFVKYLERVQGRGACACRTSCLAVQGRCVNHWPNQV